MGILFVVSFALLCVSVRCQENAQNEEDTQHHNEMAKERVHLLQHLSDRMDLDGEGLRHIKKHLQEITGEQMDAGDVQDIQAGNNAKGIFYFFKLHDYDNNQKLDGLEWMTALTDYHQDDSEKDSFKEGGKTFLQHEAEAIVDELLEKHDKNGDGYIDFYELMKSDVNSFMTELDNQPEQQGEPNAEQQQQQQSSLEQEFQQQGQESQGEMAQQQDESSEQQQQQQSSLEQEFQQQQGQESQEKMAQQQDESSEQQQQQQQQQQPSSLEQEYEQKQEQ